MRDETKPREYDRSIHHCTDASKWAEFFMQTKAEKKWTIDDIDLGLMIGWFANAMMAMHDAHPKLSALEKANQRIKELEEQMPSLAGACAGSMSQYWGEKLLAVNAKLSAAEKLIERCDKNFKYYQDYEKGFNPSEAHHELCFQVPDIANQLIQAIAEWRSGK